MSEQSAVSENSQSGDQSKVGKQAKLPLAEDQFARAEKAHDTVSPMDYHTASEHDTGRENCQPDDMTCVTWHQDPKEDQMDKVGKWLDEMPESLSTVTSDLGSPAMGCKRLPNLRRDSCGVQTLSEKSMPKQMHTEMSLNDGPVPDGVKTGSMMESGEGFEEVVTRRKIFKSRNSASLMSCSPTLRKTSMETPNTPPSDDPYLFKPSQKSPRVKGRKAKGKTTASRKRKLGKTKACNSSRKNDESKKTKDTEKDDGRVEETGEEVIKCVTGDGENNTKGTPEICHESPKEHCSTMNINSTGLDEKKIEESLEEENSLQDSVRKNNSATDQTKAKKAKNNCAVNREEINIELFADVVPEVDGRDQRTRCMLRGISNRQEKGDVVCSSAELHEIRESIQQAEEYELMLSQQFRDLQKEERLENQVNDIMNNQPRTRGANRSKAFAETDQTKQQKPGDGNEKKGLTKNVDIIGQEEVERKEVKSEVKGQQYHLGDGTAVIVEAASNGKKKTRRRKTRKAKQQALDGDQHTLSGTENTGSAQTGEKNSNGQPLVNTAIAVVAEVHHCNASDPESVSGKKDGGESGSKNTAESDPFENGMKSVRTTVTHMESVVKGVNQNGKQSEMAPEITEEIDESGDVGEEELFPDVDKVAKHGKRILRSRRQKTAQTRTSEQWSDVRCMAKDLVSKRKKQLRFKKKPGRRQTPISRQIVISDNERMDSEQETISDINITSVPSEKQQTPTDFGRNVSTDDKDDDVGIKEEDGEPVGHHPANASPVHMDSSLNKKTEVSDSELKEGINVYPWNNKNVENCCENLGKHGHCSVILPPQANLGSSVMTSHDVKVNTNQEATGVAYANDVGQHRHSVGSHDDDDDDDDDTVSRVTGSPHSTLSRSKRKTFSLDFVSPIKPKTAVGDLPESLDIAVMEAAEMMNNPLESEVINLDMQSKPDGLVETENGDEEMNIQNQMDINACVSSSCSTMDLGQDVGVSNDAVSVTPGASDVPASTAALLQLNAVLKRSVKRKPPLLIAFEQNRSKPGEIKEIETLVEDTQNDPPDGNAVVCGSSDKSNSNSMSLLNPANQRESSNWDHLENDLGSPRKCDAEMCDRKPMNVDQVDCSTVDVIPDSEFPYQDDSNNGCSESDSSSSPGDEKLITNKYQFVENNKKDIHNDGDGDGGKCEHHYDEDDDEDAPGMLGNRSFANEVIKSQHSPSNDEETVNQNDKSMAFTVSKDSIRSCEKNALELPREKKPDSSGDDDDDNGDDDDDDDGCDDDDDGDDDDDECVPPTPSKDTRMISPRSFICGRKSVDIPKDDGSIGNDSRCDKLGSPIRIQDDSDTDDEVISVRRKKRRSLLVSDTSDDADEDDDVDEDDGGFSCGRTVNMTSSSALSSLSELPTTQYKECLQKDVENIQNKIARLEAELQESDESIVELSSCTSKQKATKRKKKWKKHNVIDSDAEPDDDTALSNGKDTCISHVSVGDSDGDVFKVVECQSVGSHRVTGSGQTPGQGSTSSRKSAILSKFTGCGSDLEASPRSPTPPLITQYEVSSHSRNPNPANLSPDPEHTECLPEINSPLDDIDADEARSSRRSSGNKQATDGQRNIDDENIADCGDDEDDEDDDDKSGISTTATRKRKRCREDAVISLSRKKRTKQCLEEIPGSESNENLKQDHAQDKKEAVVPTDLICEDNPRDVTDRAQVRTPLRLRGSPMVVSVPANQQPAGNDVIEQIPQLRTPLRSYSLQQSIVAKLSANQKSPYDVSKELEFPHHPDWCFAASGINKHYHMPYITRFIELLGATFSKSITEETTHVLMKPASLGSRRCQRTLKYFQALAHHKWLVSVDWVINSVKRNRMLPVEMYEIVGDTVEEDEHFAPQRSRMSKTQLLEHHQILCHGPFRDLTKNDLSDLIMTCGGDVVTSLHQFTPDPDVIKMVLVDTDESELLPELQKLQQDYGCFVVTKDWLLDSIGTYCLRDINIYLLSAARPQH